MKRFANTNISYHLLTAVILTLCESMAYAENGSPNMMSEEDYIGEVPKVLTVSRLSQAAADVPSAVTVIDRETIRASGIIDLPDIFRLVPGMYVGANAGYVYNTNHTVSYHGITSAYAGSMQVMINGRSVYSPLFGGVNWSELPIAIIDIDRIEVTRGPNAASYGANSYFGVINIVTQAPAETPASTILATHGSGRNEFFYRHAGKQDALSYRFTTGYRQDDGLNDRNDFKRTRFMNAQADYHVNFKDTLEFEFGIADGARGEGNIEEDPFVFLPRTKQMNNHYGLVRWRHHISDTSDFTLQAFHSYDKSDDETTSINLRPLLDALGPLVNDNLFVSNTVVQQRADIEAQQTFAVGSQIRAVWGGSLRQDSVYAPHFLDTRKTDYFNLQRLFGHVEWRAHDKLTLNAGAMMEHNDFTGTDISPRVSLNFKPHPNHTFRIGASSALRTPNYVEEKFKDRLVIPTTNPAQNPLIFQYRANKGNLAPEQIISRELGYMGKVGRLQVDVRLFSDQIDDVIKDGDRTDFTVPANALLLNIPTLLDVDIVNHINQGGAKVEGLEFQANWQLSRNTSLLVNHSYIHIRETQDGLKRDYVTSAPRNTFSSLLSHRFNRHWDASFAYYQTSEANLLGDGEEVDLIRKSDLRVARKFESGRWNGEVTMVVENLFNDHYEEFAQYNTFKRRGRINVRLDF